MHFGTVQFGFSPVVYMGTKLYHTELSWNQLGLSPLMVIVLAWLPVIAIISIACTDCSKQLDRFRIIPEGEQLAYNSKSLPHLLVTARLEKSITT